MSKILIDGRFVGVGDSMTRYTLEILNRLLSLDKGNEYILLLRPQGVGIAEQFLKNQKSNIKDQNDKVKIKDSVIASDQRKRGNLSKDKIASSLTPRNDNEETQQFDNLTLEVLDIPHYSLSEQTKLLSYLNQKKFDLVHFVQFNHPVRYRGKFVVTIHDLTLMHYGEGNSFLKQLGFRAIMQPAIKNSAKIITISETSKEDIVRFYGIKPEKVAVTLLAVDPRYNDKIKNQMSNPSTGSGQAIKNFRTKYGISEDYILYTGMWKKHKNLLRMLRAFEMTNQKSKIKNQNDNSKFKNLQLVLAGKVDNREPDVLSEISRINNLAIRQFNNPPIITTGFLAEDELPLAYAGALAYCIPSLSEGFGLPPLEAMACGVPVISSNISAMPEILGDAPLYFNPLDVSDIAQALEKVITDKDLREKLIKKGLEQVKKYSWEDTAKKTLEVYKKILASKQ